MERLLSSDMHRRILLLNQLYGVTEWLTSEKLARSLNCSSKTLFSDCQYLEERWGAYLTVEISKKSGIKMIVAPHRSIHDVYTEIIREAPAFALLEAVFFHPEEESDYFEEKLFMSKSTLYRLTRKINTSLKDRELKLSQKPFYLYGKAERQIRYFFAAYFLEVYGIHAWPFSLDKNEIMTFVKKIDLQFELGLTDIQIIHLAFSVAVTIIRQRQGYYVQVADEDRKELSKEQEQMLPYQKEIQTFTGQLPEEVSVCWYEDFIYTFFWWNFGWTSKQEKQRIKETGQLFVQTLQQALGIPITAESQRKIVRLFQNIYALHNMYPFKRYMIYDRFSFSSKAIRQTYVVFTAVVEKALQGAETQDDFPWNSLYVNELLHETMIYWTELPLHMDALRKTVTVSVLSDLGQEHARSLSNQLIIAFQNKIVVSYQARTLENTMPTEHPQTDLYVANYLPEELPSEKLIVVEDVLSATDFNDLRDFIDTVRLVLPKDIPYLQE